MAESAFKTKTMKRKNVKGLALSAPPKAPVPSAGDAQIPGALGNDEGRADTLEIGVEFRLDLKAEDLIVLRELGSGNGGTVSKVQHAATKVIMARKIIHVEAKNEVRKRIVRELRIMHDCNSDYIVAFYGAFQNDTGDVIMCMEYMDVGSLDWVSKTFGPVRVDVLGKIAEAVLGGLSYLYQTHRIMHRDLKPSNILVNSKGQIKLCDFGVSSELEGSIAETFVGTGTYMAPERIQGSPYTVKSDVWSVGLTLMELAIGKFPFNNSDNDGDEPGGPQGILDLLQQIVLEPAPKLPKSDAFPSILEDMIAKCLLKDPTDRPTPKELYEHDPFLLAAKRTPVDLEAWAISMLEHNKRKSHLAPSAPSPAVREKLRERSPPKNVERTPTNIDSKYADTNGSGAAPARPAYPIRTSSASSGQNIMALPIRPAPPPSAGSPQVRVPPNGGLPAAPRRWNSEV
ncbi:dual specificity mitogen-activated protein kinase [Lindgomyces ingoldianus]|uniref:Dual specificity mitogen-activated protein kinase n=1 Tax=Lindgomyces ingoldianus TaxID=673940 RepID=A0ACB6R8E4_9PLEO|nr:dual specificity mitogen-activated protein kinase [Lindgomyces ingoldianus]KAF2475421.1 dual specificity mitogen-activated protein kinase [Lindgomyces ingoldianus]